MTCPTCRNQPDHPVHIRMMHPHCPKNPACHWVKCPECATVADPLHGRIYAPPR